METQHQGGHAHFHSFLDTMLWCMLKLRTLAYFNAFCILLFLRSIQTAGVEFETETVVKDI